MADAVVLTRRGLRIPKHEAQDRLKALLTITPLIQDGGPGKAPLTFKAYAETPKAIYVPRFVGMSIKLPAPIQQPLAMHAYGMKFHGSLRPSQVEIVKASVKQCQDHGGGLLVLPTGFGKTVCALWIACQLGVRTLVLAHKSFLLDQWAERIQQYVPQASVGRLQQDVIDVEGKDIVLGMLQSVSKREYEPSTFEGIGLTIVDEVRLACYSNHIGSQLCSLVLTASCCSQCHHISAPVFSKSMFKCTSKYMLGLSATPGKATTIQACKAWLLVPKLTQLVVVVLLCRSQRWAGSFRSHTTPDLVFRSNHF